MSVDNAESVELPVATVKKKVTVPAWLKNPTLRRVTLFVISVVALAIITDWVFSLMLMALLTIHELGHAAAMRLSGLKVKTIEFVPLLGAFTKQEGKFTSAAQWVFILLAGPFTGIPLAFAGIIGYLATDYSKCLDFAALAAVLNLFNLIPLKPLDGGHVFDAITKSIGPRVRLIASLAMAAGVVYLFMRVHSVGLMVMVGVAMFFAFINVGQAVKAIWSSNSSGHGDSCPDYCEHKVDKPEADYDVIERLVLSRRGIVYASFGYVGIIAVLIGQLFLMHAITH